MPNWFGRSVLAAVVLVGCSGPVSSEPAPGSQASGSSSGSSTPGSSGSTPIGASGSSGISPSGAVEADAAGVQGSGVATGQGSGASPAASGSDSGGSGNVLSSEGGTPPNTDGGVVAGTASGKSAGCGTPAPAADKPGNFIQHHIAVTGIAPTVKPATAGGSWTDRVYYLDLPTGYDPATPYPVVFGGGGCGGQIVTNGSNGGFAVLPQSNKLAIQIGLSYVWPQGGGACFADNGADTPDLPYFDAIMKEIEANYCIDKGKVFIGGYSSGAWEAITLGLARGGTVVRGISTAAGGLRMDRPTPTNLPIAALLLTGGADNTNPATGPTGSDLAVDLILKTNGCVGTDTTPWPTCAGCACLKYNGCPSAYPVIRCRPPGAGHTDGGGTYKTAIWSVWSTLP